ncbi:PhzF family phenazine biosynthesis protein [Pseudomonas sp. KNUC1026]|nr:PhzF family phenazine biosynthesis protein [Pseudomonas sp. KNUC1026]UFH48397.1 PhzF family phenazine biosynthesis protein [Pseudomonas sp. KNUC1026]
MDYFQVDAFSDRPFAGNSAIVYRLDAWLPDAQMQRIANEHNLAETAFIVAQAGGWRIRWFTPLTEVPLCGHATLAAAHVLRTVGGVTEGTLLFDSASGPLPVTYDEGRLWLEMSVDPLQEEGVSLTVQRALGIDVVDVLAGSDLLVVLESEDAVRYCRPDMNAVAQLGWPGVTITARGAQCDFVSRCFAPG